MFQQHGSFETLEIQIKKKKSKSREDAKSGGWYTRFQLETKEGWSKQGASVYFAIQSIHFYPMIFDGHSLLSRYNFKIIGHTSQYPEVNGDKGHSMGTEDRKHQG